MNRAAEALRAYMSELSEEAFSAGWMYGLEFELWSIVVAGPRRYGQIQIDAAHIERLRELANECGGWICWDENANEEVFAPAEDWERICEANKEW